MNNFMQIMTLQNPTFNMWVWIIGTVIVLIFAGLSYEEEPTAALMLAFFSWAWPMSVALLIMFLPVYIPFWVGRKLRTWKRKVK